MKSDRKRLKAEKLELLNQMKQLYTTLEEKETELRDFIRNYQQKMSENDETIKQVTKCLENIINLSVCVNSLILPLHYIRSGH